MPTETLNAESTPAPIDPAEYTFTPIDTPEGLRYKAKHNTNGSAVLMTPNEVLLAQGIDPAPYPLVAESKPQPQPAQTLAQEAAVAARTVIDAADLPPADSARTVITEADLPPATQDEIPGFDWHLPGPSNPVAEPVAPEPAVRPRIKINVTEPAAPATEPEPVPEPIPQPAAEPTPEPAPEAVPQVAKPVTPGNSGEVYEHPPTLAEEILQYSDHQLVTEVTGEIGAVFDWSQDKRSPTRPNSFKEAIVTTESGNKYYINNTGEQTEVINLGETAKTHRLVSAEANATTPLSVIEFGRSWQSLPGFYETSPVKSVLLKGELLVTNDPREDATRVEPTDVDEGKNPFYWANELKRQVKARAREEPPAEPLADPANEDEPTVATGPEADKKNYENLRDANTDPKVILELKAKLEAKFQSMGDLSQSERDEITTQELTRHLQAQGLELQIGGVFAAEDMQLLHDMLTMLQLSDKTLEGLQLVRAEEAAEPEYSDSVNRVGDIVRIYDMNTGLYEPAEIVDIINWQDLDYVDVKYLRPGHKRPVDYFTSIQLEKWQERALGYQPEPSKKEKAADFAYKQWERVKDFVTDKDYVGAGKKMAVYTARGVAWGLTKTAEGTIKGADWIYTYVTSPEFNERRRAAQSWAMGALALAGAAEQGIGLRKTEDGELTVRENLPASGPETPKPKTGRQINRESRNVLRNWEREARGNERIWKIEIPFTSRAAKRRASRMFAAAGAQLRRPVDTALFAADDLSEFGRKTRYKLRRKTQNFNDSTAAYVDDAREAVSRTNDRLRRRFRSMRRAIGSMAVARSYKEEDQPIDDLAERTNQYSGEQGNDQN